MHEVSLPHESAGGTHVGLVRSINEDSFLVRPDVGLWAIADGMGGHQAGEVASTIVVDALASIAETDSAAAMLRACVDGMQQANAAIRSIGSERGIDVIGTTVVILLVSQNHFACLWSGDSRIYRVGRGGIKQVTRDHSEAQEMIDRGVLTESEAKSWSRRNVITKAVGAFAEVELEVQHGDVEPGDIFVLCSDGLTAHVANEEIAAISAETDAQQACERLIALTLERGAQDNVTVVVIRFQPEVTNVRPGGPPIQNSAST